MVQGEPRYCPRCGGALVGQRCDNRGCVSVTGWECPVCYEPLDDCSCDPEDGDRFADLRLPCPYCGEVLMTTCPHVVAADWERLSLDESNKWAVSPFQGVDLDRIDEPAGVLKTEALSQQLGRPLGDMIEAWGTDHGGCYHLVLWERFLHCLPGFAEELTIVKAPSVRFWLACDAGAVRRRIHDQVDELDRECRRLVGDVH